MKKFNIFLFSIFLGLSSIGTTSIAAVESSNSEDYKQFSERINNELKDIDKQIANLQRSPNNDKQIESISAKRKELDKDLMKLEGQTEPKYSELKWNIEQENSQLKRDVNNQSNTLRMPASTKY